MTLTFKPATLDEALSILAEQAVIPVGGGTDVMVRHRRHGALAVRIEHPALFVAHLKELESVEVSESELRIGGAVTLTTLFEHPAVPAGLKDALREFASPAIRNTGTIAGNICNASPAADTLPFLYTAGAHVVLNSASGERDLALADFITGPGQTSRRHDELLTTVVVPRLEETYRFYRKVAPRRSNALSKLSIHASAEVSGGTVGVFRLALGAVAPTVVRNHEWEQKLAGATRNELHRTATELVEGIRESIRPIDDQRSTAEYRKNTALRLVQHVLETDLPAFMEST